MVLEKQDEILKYRAKTRRYYTTKARYLQPTKIIAIMIFFCETKGGNSVKSLKIPVHFNSILFKVLLKANARKWGALLSQKRHIQTVGVINLFPIAVSALSNHGHAAPEEGVNSPETARPSDSPLTLAARAGYKWFDVGECSCSGKVVGLRPHRVALSLRMTHRIASHRFWPGYCARWTMRVNAKWRSSEVVSATW